MNKGRWLVKKSKIIWGKCPGCGETVDLNERFCPFCHCRQSWQRKKKAFLSFLDGLQFIGAIVIFSGFSFHFFERIVMGSSGAFNWFLSTAFLALALMMCYLFKRDIIEDEAEKRREAGRDCNWPQDD